MSINSTIIITIICSLLFSCSIVPNNAIASTLPDAEVHRIYLSQEIASTSPETAPQASETPQAYIRRMSIENDVNPVISDYIAEHESRYCKDRLGDMNIFKNGKPIRARGCFQITEAYHPEISDACAFDIVCATSVVMPWLKDKRKCMQEFTTCRWYYNGRS